MAANQKTTRAAISPRVFFAVLGDPIQHSLSPRIFKLFAEQSGLDLDYQAIQVKAHDLPAKLAELASKGYQGINLTTPLKQVALKLVHAYSDAARLAGAMNVLTFRPDGSYYGDNTDGRGLIQDLLRNKNYPIQGKTILILGAGGAVRGILPALLQENPGSIYIANRSPEKPRLLARDFSGLKAIDCSEINQHRYNLILHCTNVGLTGQALDIPAGILANQSCCYDLSYGKSATWFLDWAKGQGAAKVYDGLGMLVEQAAVAFEGWCGKSVDTASVISVLAH